MGRCEKNQKMQMGYLHPAAATVAVVESGRLDPAVKCANATGIHLRDIVLLRLVFCWCLVRVFFVRLWLMEWNE